MTAILERAYTKSPCNACKAGLHQHCPRATFSPGAGKQIAPAIGSQPARYEGQSQWCPCDDCADKAPRCRDCGRTDTELAHNLTCVDGADCALAIEQRLAESPLHQLLAECQRTRVVDGEVIERKRRPTPVEKQARKAAKAAAVARPCTCGCEGTTKGGAFLPGHDARFVSIQVQAILAASQQRGKAPVKAAFVAAYAALEPFPALRGKLDKRVKPIDYGVKL